MARRGIWIVSGLVVLGLSVAGVVWATWPESPPPTDWSKEYDTTPRSPETTSLPGPDFPIAYELTSRPADSIPPGTLVEKSASPGWTHLVIKSLPRLREDHGRAGRSNHGRRPPLERGDFVPNRAGGGFRSQAA